MLLSAKEKLIYSLIVVFPITYIWYSLIFSNQNMRIFYFAYIGIIFLCYLLRGKKIVINKGFFILMGGVVVKFVFDIIFIGGNENISDALLVGCAFILMYIFGDLYFRQKYMDYVIKNEKIIFLLYLLYLVGIVVSVIIGKGISYGWGTTSLQGPYGLAHIFAYEVMVMSINSLVIWRGTAKNKWLIMAVMLMLLMIMTNVRSTLLCMGIVILYYFISKRDVKRIIYIIILIIVFLLLFRFTPLFNTVIEKTMNAKETGDITNARLLIWQNGIRCFANGNLREKIFGNGISEIMDYNMITIRMRVHSHNDFLDMLSGYGIISLGMYIYLLIRYVRGKCWAGVLVSLLALIWFNGVYSYCSFVVGLCAFRTFFDVINSDSSRYRNGPVSSFSTK